MNWRCLCWASHLQLLWPVRKLWFPWKILITKWFSCIATYSSWAPQMSHIRPEIHCRLLVTNAHLLPWRCIVMISLQNWGEALQTSVSFIRQTLDNDGRSDHVLSIWGRSFRQGKARCAPLQATTMQVHCSVPDDKLMRLLSRSGLKKLYCTPKITDGSLDTTFRVLWLNSDSCQAAVMSAKVANSLGLVKERKTLGLRFRDADFDAAWDILFPNLPRPSKKSGDKVFRVDGLPFGVTLDMMGQWADKIGWKCQPMSSLGPQAMLIRADDEPPAGINMFNAHPVIIRYLPPRMEQSGPLIVVRRAAHQRKPAKCHSWPLG